MDWKRIIWGVIVLLVAYYVWTWYKAKNAAKSGA